MTSAIEEFISHINRRISVLEHELDRLQSIRQGISEGRGTVKEPAKEKPADPTRKVA